MQRPAQGEAAARREDRAAPRRRVGACDVHLDVLVHHVEIYGVVEKEASVTSAARTSMPPSPAASFSQAATSQYSAEVDGGDARAVLGGDEAGGPADPGAGVEHSVVPATCARSRAAASRPRLWKSSRLARSDGWSAMACFSELGEGALDARARQASGVGRFDRWRSCGGSQLAVVYVSP